MDFERSMKRLEEFEPLTVFGRVRRVNGPLIESVGPPCGLGEICRIQAPGSARSILSEVVGFGDKTVYLMPLTGVGDIGPDWKVERECTAMNIPVGDWQIGRILGGLGRPIDGKGMPDTFAVRSVDSAPPAALRRRRIEGALPTGIRAVDGLLTLARGQRIGIFSGSGVGKSTLMGMVARGAQADVNVIGLIGERGREVREFIEADLQESGLEKSVIVVATSDLPAVQRVKAAHTATAIAEHFRDEGKDVLLMMDSITRYAVALREIGLAMGEPPTVRGYPPSMFAALPRLLERSGPGERGTITGVYTVLVEGDDLDEPVADSVRGILDGHWVLSRALAHKNQYPALDLLGSVSRVMPGVVPPEHLAAANKLRGALAAFRESEDLIRIGAYAKGSSTVVDKAIAAMPDILEFLKQDQGHLSGFTETVKGMKSLAAGL